jgi:hypothetical protein
MYGAWNREEAWRGSGRLSLTRNCDSLQHISYYRTVLLSVSGGVFVCVCACAFACACVCGRHRSLRSN